MLLHAGSKDSDLICVFYRRTGHFVGFVCCGSNVSLSMSYYIILHPCSNHLNGSFISLFFSMITVILYKFSDRQACISGKTKGHLCLWREDSLKEKYNTKYYKIYFYVIFRACKYILMDKSIYLPSFTLAEAPYLAGINIRDAL